MDVSIFLLLGANLGDRLQTISLAIEKIKSEGITIVNQSSIYETAAWGKSDQAAFLNQVIEVQTLLSPTELLTSLLFIENLLGRKRKEKWGAREIDIDILFFGSQVIETNELKVPHPSIADRRFTLVPLVEIAPHFIHPTAKKTCSELLRSCSDPLDVKLYSAKDF